MIRPIRPNPDQLETATRLALPGVVIDLREMRRFARRHQLRLRGVSGYTRFREARRFGIDLLPPMSLGGVIVDVGANEGQFARALLAIAPKASIHAFEPEPATAARLRQLFAGDRRVSVHEQAIAGSAGTATLHTTANTVFSSLHTPLPSLSDHYPRGTEPTGVVTVETAALDSVVSGPVAVLKIDVQGAELEVLAGASGVLQQTTAVLLEISFAPHYDAEASIGELHRTMLDADFILYGLATPRRSVSTHALLWADACYVRR
jgi:FkbM family methyltransferase